MKILGVAGLGLPTGSRRFRSRAFAGAREIARRSRRDDRATAAVAAFAAAVARDGTSEIASDRVRRDEIRKQTTPAETGIGGSGAESHQRR